MTEIFEEIFEEYKKEKYKTVEKIYELNKKELNTLNVNMSVKELVKYIELFTLISSTYFFLNEEEKAVKILTNIMKLYNIKKEKIEYDDDKYLFFKEIYESLMLIVYYLVKIKDFEVAKDFYLEAYKISKFNYEYWFALRNETEIEIWKELLSENVIKIARIEININKRYDEARIYLDNLNKNIKNINVKQYITILDFYVTVYKNLNDKDNYLKRLKFLNTYFINNLNINNFKNYFEIYINKLKEYICYLDDNETKQVKEKNKEIFKLISKDDELKNNSLFLSI